MWGCSAAVERCLPLAGLLPTGCCCCSTWEVTHAARAVRDRLKAGTRASTAKRTRRASRQTPRTSRRRAASHRTSRASTAGGQRATAPAALVSTSALTSTVVVGSSARASRYSSNIIFALMFSIRTRFQLRYIIVLQHIATMMLSRFLTLFIYYLVKIDN